MATQLKLRGGTTAQHSTFTGAEKEVTVDTTKGTLVVHDNATAGGFPMLREDLSNNTSVTTNSGSQTLTNKRINPRVLASTSNSATPTLNTDNYDMMIITGQSAAITSFSTNLSGTPVNGQKLLISITGISAIAITWGASFESSVVTLPTTTVSTNRLDVGFIWNVATSKWRCVASA